MINEKETDIRYLTGKLIAHLFFLAVSVIPLTIFLTIIYISSFESLSWFQSYLFAFFSWTTIDCLYNIIATIYKINRL